MFARELFAHLDQVIELLPDSKMEEVQKDEQVIDELNEDFRRLWTLRDRFRVAAQKQAQKSMHVLADFLGKEVDAQAREEISQLNQEMLITQLQFEAVEELFWVSIRTAFPETKDDTIGIRKGWKLVRVEQKRHLTMLCGIPGL